MIQLKNTYDLFRYLMQAFEFQLNTVETKKGLQRRVDSDIEDELKSKTKEFIKVKDLQTELKLGPKYNRTSSPWIMLSSKENSSGTKGRYVGISFDEDEICLWIGFGRTFLKTAEVIEKSKEYKIKYSLIEPNLKNGFEYKPDSTEAIIIEKRIKLSDFDEAEFNNDLTYITNLYKAYEVRFENATLSETDSKSREVSEKKQMQYEELNQRMLELIAEVGNLAQAIKDLGRV